MKKIFLVLLLLAGCSQKQVRNPSSSFPIIDAHAHFHSKKMNLYQQPSPSMLSDFEEAGITASVIHLSADENEKVKVDRNGKLSFATCMGLHPGDSVQQVEKGIREGRYQCLKVYLGYVPRWATDKFYHPFYRLAERHDIPVVFHTGDTYDKMAKVKYADPLQVDEIAVQYPQVRFVLAHMGNPWFQSAAEVVYKNDNVYVDVSGLILGDPSQFKADDLDEIMIKPIRWFYAYVENPNKFLFGTDWPLVKAKPYLELMKKIIPEKDWKKFFCENANLVFKLKQNCQ